ncbi:hypothetical protein DM01DRAFT_1340784 [Hesseltinella vesiculosa]|uniref:UspA domain-containing protein n=1 Tax=Hesseltinella vesiculosa TaxID=101127 RepID=A0A1X2G440_9FUNG|nr:hypothetical protein DM01DRAFT_1340784 [Hesseltinella vesiculosa]
MLQAKLQETVEHLSHTKCSSASASEQSSVKYLRHGTTQLDLLWNDMEVLQWNSRRAEEDEGASDSEDETLKRITEANRRIGFDSDPIYSTASAIIDVQCKPSILHDPKLRTLLCFGDSSAEQQTYETDRKAISFIYGAGSQGNQIRKSIYTTDLIEIDTDRKYKHKYMILCDFSHESLYAMEWAMGTMLRDHDELLIVAVSNGEDNLDIRESVASLEESLQLTLNVLIDEAKKRLSRMMLYDIKLTCCAAVGRVKEALKQMIRQHSPTMVVCGCRGRGTVKG